VSQQFVRQDAGKKSQCYFNCAVSKRNQPTATSCLPKFIRTREVIRRADPNKMMKAGLRLLGIAYLYSTTTRDCVAPRNGRPPGIRALLKTRCALEPSLFLAPFLSLFLALFLLVRPARVLLDGSCDFGLCCPHCGGLRACNTVILASDSPLPAMLGLRPRRRETSKSESVHGHRQERDCDAQWIEQPRARLRHAPKRQRAR
jgi:hypothetical protein